MLNFEVPAISMWSLITAAGWTLFSMLGGAGIFAFLGRTYFSAWLDKRFKDELQKSAHKHSKEVERLRGVINSEIEHLKGRVNAQADRRLRMHQYEFETLPKMWRLVSEAFGSVGYVIASWEYLPIDVNNANTTELEKIAKQLKYDENETEFFLKHKDKLQAIRAISKRKRLYAANSAVSNAREFLRENGIFWTAEITEEIFAILDDMNDALIYNEIEDRRGLEASDYKKYIEATRLFIEGRRTRLARLQELIKSRLNVDLLDLENKARMERDAIKRRTISSEKSVD